MGFVSLEKNHDIGKHSKRVYRDIYLAFKSDNHE